MPALLYSRKTPRRGEGGEKKEHQTHLRNPSNILPAIFLTESQILIQPESNIVPIQPVRRQPQMQKVLLERGGNGRLPTRREAREPQCAALLAAETPAVIMRERGVPGYVSVRKSAGRLD